MSRSACSWRRSAKAFRTSFGLSADGRAAAAPTSTRALQAATVMQVPHGAVNVHGHVHEQESPTPNRHVNVSVEQLNYRPTRLSEIRRLARRLGEKKDGPGTQHPRAAERRRTR